LIQMSLYPPYTTQIPSLHALCAMFARIMSFCSAIGSSRNVIRKKGMVATIIRLKLALDFPIREFQPV
jgi:hypothetical protein